MYNGIRKPPEIDFYLNRVLPGCRDMVNGASRTAVDKKLGFRY